MLVALDVAHDADLCTSTRAVKVIVDHMTGSRQGQRQEFAADARVRIGRHPDNEVSFDAHRDLDASSRHAEIRAEGEQWTLVDVGSSNGTFVDGKRVTEVLIAPGVPLTVEFGAGGPRLRLFVGDEAAAAALAEADAAEPVPARKPRRMLVIGIATAGVAIALALAVWAMR
jgi:hypothetical protein